METIINRKQYILDEIKRSGFVTVTDLAEKLKVTEVTIRTDLRVLQKEGKIDRTHGGATLSTRSVVDMNEDIKAQINVEKKEAIANAAARLVDRDDTILVASGSTMVAFAEKIESQGQLTVVTPSIRISMKLLAKQNIGIMQLGGMIYPNTLSTRDDYAIQGLANVHCNKLFFGAEGFDMFGGITCATLEEAKLTQKMIAAASQTILLADSTKFGRHGFGKICGLEDIDILVTDSGLKKEVREKIEDLGITVIIA